MPPDSASEGGAALVSVLAVGFVLIALALVSIWDSVRPSPLEAHFQTDYWFPAEAALERQRAADAELGASVTLGGDERRVLEAFERFNRKEAGAKEGFADEAQRAAQTMMEQEAQRYLQRYGAERYRALGLLLRARFQIALTGVLALEPTGSAHLVVSSQRRSDEDGPVAEYQRMGGRFLTQALRSGLVSVNGQLSPRKRWIAGLLFTRRWAMWVVELTPVEVLMSRLEWISVKKWKVESHASLAVARRLELASEVARLEPDYPRARVCGGLLARAGLWVRAEREYVKALEERPGDLQMQANLRVVRAKLAPP